LVRSFSLFARRDGPNRWTCPHLDIRASTLEDTESYEPIVSRIATLAVIDILATGVALRQSEAWLDRVREMRRAIVRRRG
jgi:DNA-binding MurR/RpiR family transcriptional regulator